MRLSHIKLAGFKSFVDPTHIQLPGQIVGVVGPNGCGKSNVIDALRWVLGESKASALRGESMQDVIFNGSAKRKPVARASVELVFDNSLGKAIGQWSSYAEIAIKRVLQRNGESSYYINNQKVRRRDITDIFLGTGLGARAYAIVEQGMISRIIDAKPEELRVFLEEAAGVSRYRERRRETALRLNDTRDNLLRVGDILLEMDKQLLHLGAQAEVAQKYRILEKQRDTGQQLLWLVKKQEAELLHAGFTAQSEKTRTELESQTAAVRETEARLETARSSHYQYSDALHARQGELYSVNAEVLRLEQDIKHAAQQQQRLAQQMETARLQIEQHTQQQVAARNQLEDWQSQQQEAEIQLLEIEQLVDMDALPQAEAEAASAQQRYQELQREQVNLQQQLRLAQTQHDHLSRNIAQLKVRESRLLAEQLNLAPVDDLALQQTQQESVELEMLHAEQEEKLLLLQTQVPQLESVIAPLRATLQQQERQAGLNAARLHALQQLQQQSDKHLSGWLVQHGLDQTPALWQSLSIEQGWETALEAVLRERLNALALPVLEEVAGWHDAPPSRLAVFSLDPGKTNHQGTRPPGLLSLLDYVQCHDLQVRQLISTWLSLVFVATDVVQALSERGALPVGGSFVTPAGHLVDQHSVLFHAPDNLLHGVLERQREIEQLENQLLLDHESVAGSRQQLDEAELNHRSLNIQLPPLRSTLGELKLRQHALQMQLLKLNQLHERSRERSLQIDFDIEEVAGLISVEQEQQHEITGKMAQWQDEQGLLEEQLALARLAAHSTEQGLREQRLREQKIQRDLQEAGFFSRTCQDKISDLQARLHSYQDALSLAQQNLQALQAESAVSSDEAVLQQLQEALQMRQTAELALSEVRNHLEAASANLQTLEQGRMSCEHQLNALREKMVELALKEQEARLYFEQWAEKLQGVDEAALLPLSATAKPGALQNELSRLNRAIDELGAVNLAALEELQTATERKIYLDAQALDLQQAMATLEEAIRHIDRESRDLLMNVFNQVNVHLSELFPILFAGGEARLVLTGEEILDSGVQVMAQPPGKKNSSIHLLSGGEKALTAIALIFSLFQLNPAPFCLLDEVDAPLDDTNTERLCALVRKMAQHTQFVFISHNKIAMEMAEQLIGVTMQEKGVSKVVSVDIEAALRMTEE